MDKIYCGCKKTPKGARVGTQEECLKRGRVSLYGLIKVDKEMIDEFQKKSMSLRNLNKEINKLNTTFYKLVGEKKKLLKEIERTKDEDEKIKMIGRINHISSVGAEIGSKREKLMEFQKELNKQLLTIDNKNEKEKEKNMKPDKKYNSPITEFSIDDKIDDYWKIRKAPKLHNINDSNVYKLLMTYKDAIEKSSRPNAYIHELSLVEDYLKKGSISKLDELNRYLNYANAHAPEDPKLLEVLDFLNYIANRK